MTNFVAAFALIISVVGISLTAIVQVKSEAHDKELYQKFKQDIDNEVVSFYFLRFIKSRLSHH
jgi:hypothetical protein